MAGPFLLAFEGTELPEESRRALADGKAAGLTLFNEHNVESLDQVRELTEHAAAACPDDLPPLVAIDQEGGQLRGLGQASVPFAGNMALGAAGDPELARAVARAIGTELRTAGVNVNYAPVCDLATNPANVALGTRSFGADPTAVARLVAATVTGLHEAGVAATLKHFPGKGDAGADTHHGLAVITGEPDLAPFRAGIDAGADLVMSCHAAVPALTGRDDLPSTLSRVVTTDLLRTRLGFTGVSVTDALDMEAIDQGEGLELDAVTALHAGADLLLLPPDGTKRGRIIAAVDRARHRALITPDEARVAQLRFRLASHSPTEECTAALVDTLAARSVTLVRDAAGLLPLRPGPDDEVLVVQPRPTNVTPADTSASVEPELARAIRRCHPRVAECVVPHRPSQNDTGAATEAAERCAVTIVATTQAVHEPAQAALVESLLETGKPVVVVALRSPHDLGMLPTAQTCACAYSQLRPSLEALASSLFGHAPFRGRLPVDIEASG